MNLDVDIQCAIEWEDMPESSRIKLWVESVLSMPDVQWCRSLGDDNNIACNDGGQLTIRMVGNDESAQLNSAYRHREGATNVLSFSFETPRILTPPLLGDLVVCVPLVLSESAKQNKQVDAHLAHLVVHGVLHLLGYDHEDDDAALQMESLEKKIMSHLGYPNPYKDDLKAL